MTVLVYERGQTDYRDVTHVIDFPDTNYDFYLFENDYAVSVTPNESHLYWVYPPHLEVSNQQAYKVLEVTAESHNGQEKKTCTATLTINIVNQDNENDKIYETAKNHNITFALYPGEQQFIDLDVFYQGYNLTYALDAESLQQESDSTYSSAGEQKVPIYFDGEFSIKDTIFLEAHDTSDFFNSKFLLFSQQTKGEADYQILVQSC